MSRDTADPLRYDWGRPEVVPLIPPAERLLDVGCSTGRFAADLREAGAPIGEIWGIEAEPESALKAEARCDRVVVGRYPEDLPPGETFDVVVFNDVLEHMADPWQALRQTTSILRPGGAVVASIPNIRYWTVLRDLVLRADWPYVDIGPLDRTHLRFFTRSSAERLFTDSGYVVHEVRSGGIPPLEGKRAVVRVLPRDFRTLQYLFLARPADHGDRPDG